jgi:hypothetical protein
MIVRLKKIVQYPFCPIFFFLLVVPEKALAYLDLYTGSYIIQLLLGGFFGFLFVIKLFGKRIISFFKNLFSPKKRVDSRHED